MKAPYSIASKVVFIVMLIFFNLKSYAQHSLRPKVKPFKDGEVLEYDVSYKWGLIFMDAGWVTFSVQKENYNNKNAYHLVGEGGSKPNWDWFYKVKDKYESYVDTGTLRPYRYIRNSNDGGHWVFNDNVFDQKNNLVYSAYKSKKKPTLKKDTVKINYLTFDPITMIYYARAIDFSQFKPGDIIPISLYLDAEMFYKSIRYIGKEEIETQFGKIKCIKFKPSLIPGTLFKEGDEMTVWVSDDENKIPVFVETPILVGTIRASIKKASGIKSPLGN
jgi:hypothetical protein